MRSTRGLFASIAFLLVLPLAALYHSFMAWCVVVLVVDRQATWRSLGIIAVATVASVKAYSLGLAWHGTSLDAEAPILKILWLQPFVWILCESATGRSFRSEGHDAR